LVEEKYTIEIVTALKTKIIHNHY